MYGRRKKRIFGAVWLPDSARQEITLYPGIDSVFSGFSSIDDDFYEELEEILIMGDIGVQRHRSDHREISKKK